MRVLHHLYRNPCQLSCVSYIMFLLQILLEDQLQAAIVVDSSSWDAARDEETRSWSTCVVLGFE